MPEYRYFGSLKDAIDNADEGSKITVDNDVMIPGGEQYELPEGVELVIPEGEKITVQSKTKNKKKIKIKFCRYYQSLLIIRSDVYIFLIIVSKFTNVNLL